MDKIIAQYTHGDSCGCSYCVRGRELIRAAYAAGVEDAAKKVEGNITLHNHLNGLCSNCKGAAEIRKLTQK